MSNRTNPTRRILSTFGADDSIEGVDIDLTAGDVLVLGGGLLLAFLIFNIGAKVGGWPGSILGALIALVLALGATVVVYVTPPGETSAWSWLRQRVTFWRQESERSIVDANPRNRTDTLTQVSRFHPDDGAVERVDGDLVAGVRVQPANLSLATRGEWETTADQFGDALNSLRFQTMLHTTGRHIDGEQVAQGYDGRETDPDVRDNPELREVVEMYQSVFRDEFASNLAWYNTVREYYVMVSVGEREVQIEDYGAFGKLGDLPVVGGVITTLAGAASRMTRAETHVEQHRELANRVADVENAIRDVDGCSTEVLSAEELAGAIEEFWTGARSRYADGEDRLRSVPVVVSETNDAVNR